jgi:ABC-type transport system substrate-binding protein
MGSTPARSTFAYCSDCYDENFVRLASVLHQMWTQDGVFDLQIHTGPDQTDWRPNYNRNSGQHDAITLGAGAGGPDVDVQLTGRLSVIGNDRVGHRNDAGEVDQVLEQMLEAQKREVDYNKRVALVQDLQRYAAKTAYVIAGDAGHSLSYDLGQPWVGNFRTFRIPIGGNEETDIWPTLWIDESKRNA